jgi:uncharacterized membrane protein YhaH (DUF805 family)
MNWYLLALKKYATFTGRAQRSEFWYFMLFYLIFALILSGIDNMTGTFDRKAGMGVLSGLFMVAMIVPNISVTVRRLHDTDRSGWWFLICLVPLAGSIILLIFMVQKGSEGDNRFGPNPLGDAPAEGSILAG